MEVIRMGEAQNLRQKVLADIQAMKQDNESWKRQIQENEKKIAELEQIADALGKIAGGDAQ
jgi:hypothetical protein